MDDDLPAIASVHATSADELTLAVLVNPKKPDMEANWYNGLDVADASAHGWIESRLGAWIQDEGIALHCRKALQPRLMRLELEPKGYADLGSFIFS